MGLLKEKTSYRPTRRETVLAWVISALTGIAVAWWLLRPLIGR